MCDSRSLQVFVAMCRGAAAFLHVSNPWPTFTDLLFARGVNLYGLHRKPVCDLHGLTGVRCNPYGYLRFLQIQTYNHSTLYIRTVVSFQWHQLCFVNTKVNYLWHNKLCFVCLLYMDVLQRDPIPKMCFAMVLTICKDFFCRL